MTYRISIICLAACLAILTAQAVAQQVQPAAPAGIQVQPAAPAGAQAQPAAPAQPATAAQPQPTPGGTAPAMGGPPQLPPLPAHLQNASTPSSPAPDVVLASYRDGQVFLRFVLPFYAEAAPAGGQGELASVAEPFAVQSIQARTAGGEEVSAEQLAERLANEVPVVLGPAQLPPDPAYLKMLKEDTLVLLVSVPQSPAPGAPAPAGTAPAPAGTAPAPAGTAPAPAGTAPAPRSATPGQPPVAPPAPRF